MKLRSRLAMQIGACLLSAIVCVATIVEPQWFEMLFDESPDGGSGELETWLAIVISAAACLTFARLSWRTWALLGAAAPDGRETR